MNRLPFKALALFAWIVACNAYADWTPYWGVFKRSEKPSDYITGLTFLDHYFPLDLSWIGKTPITSALLNGHLDRKDCQLYFGNAKAEVDAKGFFKVKVQLNEEETPVTVNATCVDGQEAEVVRIQVRELDFFQLKKIDDGPPIKVGGSLSIGPTQVHYTETGARYPDITETALTLKAGLKINFSQNWNIGVGGYYTLTALTVSVPATSVRYLGINGRLGYSLPFIESPWRVSLFAGYYYASMFVPDNTFGYQNLMGPQFYPTLERSFSSGDSLFIYAKFSPIADGLSLDLAPLSNVEIAAGGGYSKAVSPGLSVIFGLDLANLSFSMLGKSVDSMTISGSVGIGF